MAWVDANEMAVAGDLAALHARRGDVDVFVDGGLLAASGWLALWPDLACAAHRRHHHDELDGQSAEERQATRTLFEEALLHHRKLGFLNSIMYRDSDALDGVSAGWIELGAD